MSKLFVRRLLVDMTRPIPRHWCDGDPFRTAFFNALSMSFPVGEQFFIDSVRGGFAVLPEHLQEQFRSEVKGFVGQEATHRRLHALYNEHLERQGLVNAWGPRAAKRLMRLKHIPVATWLALTAANEHLTSIFADWLLRNPEWLGRDDMRLRTMWLWHGAEESEHRSTAFDLYHAVGGETAWRKTWFRRASMVFACDVLRQTASNLQRDGTFWRWRTWRNGMSFLLGRGGVVRSLLRPWREYLRDDFHPAQQDDAASRQWLRANESQYLTVGN